MTSVDGLGTYDLSAFIQSLSERSKSTGSNSSVSGSSDDTQTNDQGIESLKTKIDEAISNALKNLDKSSSADEIMQTVKSAIDGTLKANGVDPKSIPSGMPPAQTSSNSGGNMFPTSPGKNQDSGSDPFLSKIEQLLQQNGFDVEKFRSELASEATEQSGTSMLQLFNNLSSSQGVDTQA